MINGLSVTKQTMSSVDLVAIINDLREDGKATLEHRSFTAKIIAVLGKPAEKMAGHYKAGNGQFYPCYYLPKRECQLMVMSESYKVQAAVYDRMAELEKSTLANLPDFTNPAEAAIAWAEQYKLAQLAIATKAEIGNRREATAMNTASQAVIKANKLAIELDKSKSHATIKRMEMLHHGVKFNWRLLKSACSDLGTESIDIFDANYGTVKAYPADAWMEAYALSIEG